MKDFFILVPTSALVLGYKVSSLSLNLVKNAGYKIRLRGQKIKLSGYIAFFKTLI